MKMANLRELYIDQLKDIYSAEAQLVKALPKMAKAANAPELKEAFEKHLAQTEGQVQRLEQIFSELPHSPRGKKCKGMEGLIEEGDEMAKEDAAPHILDAGLVAAAQRIEHYEIAAYGTVAAFAQRLGETEAANLLHQTLEEEKQTDEQLTTLTERVLLDNRQAAK
jgi:ferritin-like metal-binding protein YciE